MKTIQFFAGAGLLAAVFATGTSAMAANAKVCFEAESASSVQSPIKKVTPGSSSKYSGRGYLDIPWDQNKTKGVGQAVVTVNVKTAGTYYLWARTFWANGCGNSIGVGVNGGSSITLGEDGTYDKWHWVGGNTRVSLKAGANTFVIKNRETGVRVDQIFLCQDGDYTPVGKRPITS
jgi:hypothetical protein